MINPAVIVRSRAAAGLAPHQAGVTRAPGLRARSGRVPLAAGSSQEDRIMSSSSLTRRCIGQATRRLARPSCRGSTPRRSRAHRPTLETVEQRCLLATGPSATLVADIVPGADASNPEHLVNAAGTLFFGARAM